MKKVLFCVLNWGLGHASRSLPLIHSIRQKGHEVRIASDGEALTFLRSELTDIPYYVLPSSKVHYNYRSMYLNMAAAGPHLIHTYRQERYLLQKIKDEYKPDLLFSDNRYGCFHKQVHSIMISHQAQIMSRNSIVRKMSKLLLHKLTKPFNEIWIPDLKGQAGITGPMGNFSTSSRSRYIGWLSTCRQSMEKQKQNGQILILLSGPEPQRKQLEERVISNLPFPPQRFKLIRGTDQRPENSIPPGLEYIDIAKRDQVQKELLDSSMVICRSGYSTVMDLVTVGLPAVYIPTPGQFEQIYLAKRMQHLKAGYFLEQGDISIHSLKHAIEANNYWESLIPKTKVAYREELDRVLST